MSLGENSIVAAYQGKDSEKSTIRNEGGDMEGRFKWDRSHKEGPWKNHGRNPVNMEN